MGRVRVVCEELITSQSRWRMDAKKCNLVVTCSDEKLLRARERHVLTSPQRGKDIFTSSSLKYFKPLRPF